MNSKIAYVIDIGTNSVRMLKADISKREPERIYKTIRTVRTGEGTHKTHLICEAAIKRTADAIRELLSIARREEEDAPIWCFATSAVRDANNQQEFCDRIFEETGIAVRVLSGEEEANCGFVGAVEEDGGIIDIGGGSTEIIFGKQQKVFYRNSFNIGCVRGLDIFGPNPTAEEIIDWATEYFKQIDFVSAQGLVFSAIGGTATSLAAVEQGLVEYDPTLVEHFCLTRKMVQDRLDQFILLSPEQRAQVTGMDPRRADIIIFGMGILLAFFKVSGRDSVVVRESDNLEGFLKLYA